MRHDWIFDVLADLRKYADKNDLPEIAAETDRMMAVARRELAALAKSEQSVSLDDLLASKKAK